MISAIQIAVLAYLGYGALLFVFQRSLMYPGARASQAMTVPDDAVELAIELGEGTVEAWWFAPPDSGAAPAVVFAHGNAELIGDNVALARRLRAFGLGVLLVEYPGFGASAGRPSRESIATVFTIAYDRLVELPQVDAARVIGMGRSLGGGAITDLAMARDLRALVLQSTFTSVRSMVVRGYLMPGFLVKDDFDNEAVLGDYGGPVLILHGRRDRIIPFSHAERLAEERGHVRLVPLECGHNDCAWTGDEMLGPIRSFLEEAEVLEG